MSQELDVTESLEEAQSAVVGWIESLIANLPNMVAALVVVLIFYGLAKLAQRLVTRLLDRFLDHRQLSRLIGRVAFAAALALGLFIALGILELDTAVTSLLAGAGIIGLAMGFAFQDTAENFIAGVLLSIRRQFADGDLIETNDFLGIVKAVNMRSTEVQTLQGQRVTIPNSKVFQEPLINYTATGRRRVDVAVGVSYGDDLEEARKVAVGAVSALEFRDQSHDVELFFEAFGDSSINFTLRFWISFARQTDFLGARSEAIIALKKAFDQADITIPFPIRTLDFGIVGGRSLAEEVPRLGEPPALSNGAEVPGGEAPRG